MADDTYSRGYRNDPYDRGGTGGSGSAPDPLTELARLIGQSDPFATDRNRQPAPRQAEHPQSGDWRDDPNQHAQHYDHGHDDRYAGTGEPQHDTGQGYGSEHAAYQSQNGYAYPHAGQHEARYDDAAGYAEQQYHEEPQAYHPDQHPYHQDQPAYPPSGQPHYAAGQAEQGEYDDAPADAQGDYPAPSFFGDPNSRPDDYYDDEPASRRGWLVTAAALVGLAVVGTAGALAYRAVFTGGETRIITRDVGPSKITPQASQDNANKPNDRLASAGGQNERLGPPPEQPITIPEPPRTVPSAIAPSQSAAVAPAAPIAPVLPAAPSAPAQATAPVDNNGARKVRTEKIKPDQLDTAATRPVGQSRNTAPSPAQPRVVGPGPAPAPNAPLSLAPQGMSNPAPAPAPPMHTTAIAPPVPPASHAERSSGGGSGYYVQVSAQKSEDEAKSSFRGIQARHSGLLGGQQALIRRKDLGSKGVFYGAQVGPFSREAAGKLCDELKAAGQSCMVQRN